MVNALAMTSGMLAQTAVGFPWGLVSIAITFFVIAIIAYVFGARGVAGMSAGIGRTLMFVFVVVAVILLAFSLINRA